MRYALIGLLLTYAPVLACGDDSTSRGITEIDADDAPALFIEDARHQFENSYRVTYELEMRTEGGDVRQCNVVWWKGGTDRQRFDMCPPLVFGDDFDSEPWRILMFGDRDQILVCSSRLSLDPFAELDEGDGACHEDSSGIGDLAANSVYYLGFPLEYPDSLPSTYFDSIGELTFERTTEETIGGIAGRCYVVSGTNEDGAVETSSKHCYAEDGAPILKQGKDPFEYTLRATELGEVTDADFEPPYPYVDASIVNQ